MNEQHTAEINVRLIETGSWIVCTEFLKWNTRNDLDSKHTYFAGELLKVCGMCLHSLGNAGFATLHAANNCIWELTAREKKDA